MSQSCKNCGHRHSGGEVCPSCFFPNQLPGNQFTVDREIADSGRSEVRLAPANFPDLESITFQPSSAFQRSLVRARKGIASAFVATFVVCLGIFGWVNSNLEKASEAELQAEIAFEEKKYAASFIHWERALDSYQSAFSKQGQVGSLIGMSKCRVRAKDFPAAIVLLERARSLDPNEQVEEEILRCNRSIAANHLEEAQNLFQPKLYGKSFLEAKAAIKFFELGKATDAQLAGANRMAARCSMKLKDFEGTEDYLNQAFQLEGETKNNLALASQVEKAYLASRREALAQSGKNRYIPTGKLDLTEVQLAADRQASDPPSRRQGSYGGYALKTHLPVKSYQSSQASSGYSPTVRRKIGLSIENEGSAYPTYQKPIEPEELTGLDLADPYRYSRPRSTHSSQPSVARMPSSVRRSLQLAQPKPLNTQLHQTVRRPQGIYPKTASYPQRNKAPYHPGSQGY